eukprot:581252-Pelagomonas_calceolata.AAC.1
MHYQSKSNLIIHLRAQSKSKAEQKASQSGAQCQTLSVLPRSFIAPGTDTTSEANDHRQT